MAKQTVKKTTPVKKRGIRHWKAAGAVLLLIILGIFFLKDVFIQPGKKEVETTYYRFKKEGELILADSLGNKKAAIDIEIADTEYEQALGLMYRTSMEQNQGMLFVFPAEEIRSFWMMNTLISLDMIFLDNNGKIVTIHRNTKTESEQSYRSTKPAKYVLEVIAGFCDIYGITEGDRMSYK
ncbi:MAG: DUF192 domain-containing protein [Ignavibacteriaceae bacterium]|nr:DUF192 domain-containing protein [Ignavibacteriaceae bacterium]